MKAMLYEEKCKERERENKYYLNNLYKSICKHIDVQQ